MDNEKLFAIKLADEDRKVRDKCLVKIKNYISSRFVTDNDTFTEEDLVKLWKGLHYSLWMCDKPLIQEELSERICNLIDCFNGNDEQVMLFIKVYFVTIVREWNGIDKWRIDKFMMMMRFFLRKILNYLKSKKWNKKLIKEFNKIMFTHPLNINLDSVPDGISYHLADIYLEELAKVGEGLKPIRAVKMLEIFIKLMAVAKKRTFVQHVQKRVFEQIIECSDVGIDPEIEPELEAIRANGLQIGEEEDTNEYTVKFNYSKIATRLFKVANTSECVTRNKQPIYDLVKKFRALAKGIYPIDDYNLPPLHEKKKQVFYRKNKKNKASN